MVISLPLQITKKQIAPGIVVLELAGPIHMGPACHQISQHVEEHLGHNENWIIFDLSKATFLDSGGLGEIVRCFSKIKKIGRVFASRRGSGNDCDSYPDHKGGSGD